MMDLDTWSQIFQSRFSSRRNCSRFFKIGRDLRFWTRENGLGQITAMNEQPQFYEQYRSFYLLIIRDSPTGIFHILQCISYFEDG